MDRQLKINCLTLVINTRQGLTKEEFNAMLVQEVEEALQEAEQFEIEITQTITNEIIKEHGRTKTGLRALKEKWGFWFDTEAKRAEANRIWGGS